MFSLFFSTVLLGLTIAVPVGPITLLIMRRTLASGLGAGVSAGMGAAMADTFYAAIAAFGLSGIIQILNSQAILLRLGGGLMLLWMAVNIWRKPTPNPSGGAVEPIRHFRSFTSIFFLTLANPLTILGFIGVFSALDPQFLDKGWLGAFILTLGIAVGSILWQNIIALATAAIRHAISPKVMLWLNRLSASALAGFALKAFWEIAR